MELEEFKLYLFRPFSVFQFEEIIGPTGIFSDEFRLLSDSELHVHVSHIVTQCR